MRFRCAVVLCLLALAAPAQAQEEDADFWPGSHFFRHLLSARKLTPLQSVHALVEEPARSVLIVLGRPTDQNGTPILNRIPGGLEKFVRDGGAVLIATDHQLSHSELRRLSGYDVNGGKVRGHDRVMGLAIDNHAQKVDAKYIYRDQPHCIKVKPGESYRPPLFLNTPLLVNRQDLGVATNSASFLDRRQIQTGEVLARFPGGCYYSDRPLRTNVTTYAFAVSAEAGKGRLLLLADHSVFSNEMILEGEREKDNDNFLFAFNVIEWLRGPEGQRNKVLLIEDGQYQTDLKPSLRESDTPLRDMLQMMAAKANDVVLELQERHQRTNLLNRELIDRINDKPGEQIFGTRGEGNYYRFLLLIAAVLAGLYGMRRIARAAHRYDPGIPLFGAIVGKHRPAGSTLGMRHQEALVEDDLREFARESTRDWFESLPGYIDQGEQAPRVEAGSRFLQREVLHLWELTQGADCPKMGKMPFKEFLHRLDELRQMIDDGQLHVTFQHDDQA